MATKIDVFDDVSAAGRALARRNKALRHALKTIGAPHIRRRNDGFEGLFRIIVEQQVSVPSAQAIWARCEAAVDVSRHRAVARLGVDGLRGLGLTGPKARYVAGLAQTLEEGAFDFAALNALDDMAAMARLIELKGVGPWSAAIYLLFCEGRIDIWPTRDVALKHAYGAAAGAPVEQAALDAAAGEWAPYRGVAAHILWTYYAHIRGRVPI